ncbi:MAG: DUF6763 family protein [Gammaproteobacteria bacterium]
MSNEVDPVAGRWYEHIERGQKFEVVDVDDERGVIEVQYANGEIDEMDIDEWYDLEIEPIEIPEEWIGQSVVPSGQHPPYEDEDKGSKPSEDWRPRSKPPKRPWEENEEEEDEDKEEDNWADGLDENDHSRDED